MLEVRNLRISEPVTLRSDDFVLKGGSKTALIGPSGGGKTSFLRAIAGFLPIDSGALIANQVDISNLPPAKRLVSMLFQEHNLFMHLNIRQNIALGLDSRLKLSSSQWGQVDDLAQELGLADQLQKYPRAISGGQKARAALARVILQSREIVVFDEAFGAVGPAQADALRALVDERLVAKNCVILIVSHQAADYREWADQVIWLDNGVINSPKTSEKFYAQPTAEVARYFGQMLPKS